MEIPKLNHQEKNQEGSLFWLKAFPELTELEEISKTKLRQSARIIEASIGTMGFHDSDPCSAYVLRLAGCSRIYKISASGREILLYRVSAGETCILTTTCLLGRCNYPASTIVEEPVQDVVVPAEIFHQLMMESEVFRRFVLRNYGELISNLIMLIDEVAFHSISARLAGLLVESRSDLITTTHQQLAGELGSAREVVSRELKEFERQGWVKLGRACIHVLDRAALQGQAKT